MPNDQGHEVRPVLHLTARFTRADYARNVQVGGRKETQVPHLAHLLGVASLVTEESGYVSFPVTPGSFADHRRTS
jgi:hypothetical protein